MRLMLSLQLVKADIQDKIPADFNLPEKTP